MTYPNNFEQKIGFDKIRQLIDNKCLSVLGKECVDSIKFSSDIHAFKKKLEQTSEFVQIIMDDDPFPTDYFIDVRPSLRRIRPEGTFLDEKELFDLKRSLMTICDIVRFLRHTAENDEIKYPALTDMTGDIRVFPHIISKIEGILDKYGKMKDNASPELLIIRKDITTTTGNISRTLHSILKSAQAEGFIDKDVTPAMRDGRLVIPVSPSFKRKIRGIVHDESATGKTVFIEPEAVIEANNRIRELESKEKRETVRILTAFTDIIRPSVQEIIQSFIFLAEIDFIRAKALFAIDINGIKPVVDDKPSIEWRDAVHPLLYLSLKKQEKKIVTLDIELHDNERLLVISGPNAGGKSVCLKTVGLLQYMLQCGLLIPVHENSRTGIFDRIFIDIGDEQSIENDLSTYSSHLTNMKFFVRNCNEKTLLLIDEFGSGTEPLIGGALAEALLDRFNKNGSFGIVTTHYQNLKHYAGNNDGVINGAMLYDRNLMQPLFKLSIGRPGSSFAIEIARKTGLPEDVISDASEKVGSEYIDMDKYLQDIVRDKRYWENKRRNIHQQEKKLEVTISRYEEELEAVNKQRKEIVQAAKKEAQQILSEANAEIEKTIREIKEAQAEKERTKDIRRKLESFKTVVISDVNDDGKETKNRIRIRRKAKGEEVDMQPAIRIGDAVRVKGQNATGIVAEIKDRHVIVTFGMIKSTVKTDRLEKTNSSRIKKEEKKNTFISAQTADSIYEKKLNFKQEIDVRGMRGDEALQAVTYFIDDAILADVSPVRILHGTGTGILRQLIRNYLSTVQGIKKYHDENVQFGGAGITVVELE
ncbi:MAG: endonuclease MutS2 [Tannerella sp.]|nr:endonuclease MutS2 [Tannerella sp.]